jgi:hypothetical protein
VCLFYFWPGSWFKTSPGLAVVDDQRSQQHQPQQPGSCTTRRSTRSATRTGSRRTPMWSAAPTRTRRPRPPAAQRQPADLHKIRISTMTRTTTCQSGGFALAVAPPSAMAVVPWRKLFVNVSVRLLRPPYANTASVRPVRRRTRRTITRTSSLTLYA